MHCDRRLFGGLLLASAVAGVAAGCSDITPEPNDEGGGVLESPTDEADQMRQTGRAAAGKPTDGRRWRRRRAPVARSPTPHRP